MHASISRLAAGLLAAADKAAVPSLLVVVDGEGTAEALGRLIGQMEPDRTSLWFPAWDCLPYDRAAPAADIMGHRMRVLHDLRRAEGSVLVVTTPEGLLRRVPPRAELAKPRKVQLGAALDPAALGAWCVRHGYAHADRVETAGHLAVRGEVVDIFGVAARPVRITVIDGIVTAIHRYDPASQRTAAALKAIRIDPVSEIVRAEGDATDHPAGSEHRLPLFYSALETLLDYLPEGSRVMAEPAAERRMAIDRKAIDRSFADRVAADRADINAPPKAVDPARCFLDLGEWRDRVAGRQLPFPALAEGGDVPLFCLEDKPGLVFAGFLRAEIEAGRRVVLGAARAADLATLGKEARRVTGRPPAALARWGAASEAEAGAVGLMKLSADHGFVDEAAGVTLVTAADLLGHHARASAYHAAPAPWHMGDGEFACGDLVIHVDHGMGVLRGLETVEDGAASGRDTLRIDYAKDAHLLTPVEELDRVWRYGAAQEGVTLDKLDSDGWQRRRAQIAREVNETAARLVELARARDSTPAPVLVPPRRDYERFVEGFAHAPTPDQIHAVDDVLRDLASGRPMDRLVVGDVGFGKTEVALRAAAAAVLAGWQVAVVAPTTVLVRQHIDSFAARFEALGIDVGHLSRLVAPAEARRVKQGLADGAIRLVVATHALAAEDVRFEKLGLLIVDEEQRFGAADKARIRDLGTGVHVLTLSATPIPRTLQSALVGLQDLSVIATPPARRRPIRTLLAPFDTATVRTALLHEKARGGQSFVVVPRIEDIAPLQDLLGELLPDLDLVVGHGRLDPQAVDEAMVGFAGGQGDVLLATSIIESGLDVPRANTMIVCQADRFGLAQLHQLRGRVGRGRRQGTCYLMTAADHDLPAATRHRLETLATLDRLGSGMAISVQDLDMRGAGDLIGEDQAGHVKLIGLGLYQHMLQFAIRQARGTGVEDWTPELHGGEAGRIDAGYIPEVDVRLNLYARLARLTDGRDVDALGEEIEDRFGPLPEAVVALLDRARLRGLCRTLGIARVDAGPRAVALTPRTGTPADGLGEAASKAGAAATVKNGRIILAADPDASEAEPLRALAGRLHAMA